MTSDDADWRSKEMFDRSIYERLDLETGGAGREIVATLLSVAEPRKLAMIDAAKAGRAADLARVAHTAKSGSRSVGLLRFSAFCARIEQLSSGDPQDLAALCPEIESEFDLSVEILQRLERE